MQRAVLRKTYNDISESIFYRFTIVFRRRRFIKMKNRHTIIRAIMALIWIAVGVIGIVRHDMKMAILSFAVGALFAFSAFMQKKKD